MRIPCPLCGPRDLREFYYLCLEQGPFFKLIFENLLIVTMQINLAVTNSVFLDLPIRRSAGNPVSSSMAYSVSLITFLSYFEIP
jgi:hypothetical protein